MLNQRLAAAQRVRDAFLPSEKQQHAAVRGSVATLSAMLDVSELKGVRLDIGLDAFDKVAAAVLAATIARRASIEAHAALAPLPAELNLPTRAWGDDGEDCPEYFTGATTTERPPITAVA